MKKPFFAALLWSLLGLLGPASWAQSLSADGDRVPDYWERRHGLNVSSNDGAADADGDGASNYSEYLADTDPTNPASLLAVEITPSSGAAFPLVGFPTSSNRAYRLEYGPDLNAWSPADSNRVGSGAALTFPDTNGFPVSFFKVSALLPALLVQPDSFDYGLVDVRTTSLVQQVYVSNEDVVPHELTDVQLTGLAPAEFALTGVPPLNTVLSPGQTVQFDLSFTPTGAGLRSSRMVCLFDAASQAAGAPLSGAAEYNYLINAGGDAYTDSLGRIWIPDGPFVNAGNVYVVESTVGGTDQQPLYRTERWTDTNFPADLTFSFPVEPGPYEVRLHFAEIYEGNQTLGSRIFDVYVNDRQVLTNYDIVADAGYLQAAIKEFYTEATNELLTVRFDDVVNYSKVSALEVRSGRMWVETSDPQWGHVPVGEEGAMLPIVLRNVGPEPLTIQTLILDVLLGHGSDFRIVVDGVVYVVAHDDSSIPVDIAVPGGGAKTLWVQFIPSEESDNVAALKFAGTFPARSVLLQATGGNPTGNPYLHVVLRHASLIVDYDQTGGETVRLDGAGSHTHQFGHALERFEWATNGVAISTNVLADIPFELGLHRVSLTIADDNEPPMQLSSTSSFEVVSPDLVPGSLVLYYQAVPGSGEGSSSFYIEHVPTNADFGERVAGVSVTGATWIGSTPYTGNVMAAIQAQANVPAPGSYAFQLHGGRTGGLWVAGVPYAGPLSLPAGRIGLEARFAVDSVSQLPLAIEWSVDASPFTAVSNALVTHDERFLRPIVNTAPSEGLDLGGNQITLTGLGFFPTNQVVVHWGGTDFSGSQLLVSPESIALTTPPSNGFITVTVETPNGMGKPFSFLYTSTGPAPIAFHVTNVAAVIAPTQGSWGPDGRFYIGSALGTITVLSFDDQYQVAHTQVITTLENFTNKNILGIGFNPREAGGPIRIYVAHSHLYAQEGSCFTGPAPYSGSISILTGPNFDAVETLIEGLPVSNHDHGVNGLQFDHDGNLLIAIGGNSNAGVTNCAMGGLPESPLTAAILKAPIGRPDFDGRLSYVETLTGLADMDQVAGNDVDVAPGKDVSVLASGFRNPFDLAFTTAGKLYATDNGPNSGFGAASTSAAAQGPDPEQNDTLNHVIEGHYYGHPNRNRGRTDSRQNVYYNNAAASLPGVFSQGMGSFVPSMDGIDEYRAETFNGAMRGNLILQQWNGFTYRVKLSTNGLSIVSAEPLPIAMNALDVASGPGGALVGVDYTENQVLVATPDDVSATGMKALDIFPWRGPATGAVSFVIGGTGFSGLGDTHVLIGNAMSTLTSVSSNRIRGILPNTTNPTPVLLDITVNSGVGQSILSNAFRYLLPAGGGRGQWTAAPELPEALGEISAGVIRGLIYVVGEGRPGTFAYDPFAQTWSSNLAVRPYPGSHHAAEVIGHKLYLFGGLDAGENKVQIYDPQTDAWTLGADVPWDCGSGASALLDGKVYLAGGISGSSTVTSNAVYDPVSNAWTLLSPMPTGRNHAASGTDGKKFYIFGGRGPGSGDGNVVAEGFDDVWVFDPASNAWTGSSTPGSSIPPLPQKRGGMGKAVFFEGEFYVMGGETTDEGTGQVGNNVYDRVDVYHPTSHTWRLAAPLLTPRHGIFPVVLDRSIYVPAGGESAGHAASAKMDAFER